MPDFSNRTLLPEKMDQPDASPEATLQALKELEIINKLLGGYQVIFDALDKTCWRKENFSIMDMGCGGGDLLRAIGKKAKKYKLNVQLTGVDRNPLMIEYASAQSNQQIKYRVMDVFDNALLNEKLDITMSSLFCHHFDNEEIVDLIKRMMAISNVAVIINDLHRHWFAYYAIRVITFLFSKTALVKYDGPLSVARSLNRNEWENILRRAGAEHYTLRWMWAFRWQIIIKTNS